MPVPHRPGSDAGYPGVIGLKVVAAGTSFPELAVSATAAYRGSPDLAVGNVDGSNILTSP